MFYVCADYMYDGTSDSPEVSNSTQNVSSNVHTKSISNKMSTESHQSLVDRRSRRGKGQFTCRICQQCFSASSVLREHMDIHMNEKVRPHSCTISSRTSTEPSQLDAHQWTQVTLQCAICKEHFSQLSDLKQHMASHRDLPDAFTCDVCDQQLHTLMDFERHRREHLENYTPKPHVCVYCCLLYTSPSPRDS